MMSSIEQTCEKIFRSGRDWRCVLLGGLLCLSIIGIPLAFGYLFRYIWQIRVSGDLSLPEWSDWRRLFVTGLHFLGVWLAWFFVPFIVFLFVHVLLNFVFMDCLWWASYLMLAVVWIILPVVFCSALVHYQREQNWLALLDFEKILGVSLRKWRRLVVPSFAWVGVTLVGLPVFPFAFFFGFILVLAYTTVVFQETQDGLE